MYSVLPVREKYAISILVSVGSDSSVAGGVGPVCSDYSASNKVSTSSQESSSPAGAAHKRMERMLIAC